MYKGTFREKVKVRRRIEKHTIHRDYERRMNDACRWRGEWRLASPMGFASKKSPFRKRKERKMVEEIEKLVRGR